MKPIAQHLFEAERDYLVVLMAESGDCVKKAAEMAGIGRSCLYQRLHRHHLVKGSTKRPRLIVRKWRMAQVNS